jgi:hypothetical protein
MLVLYPLAREQRTRPPRRRSFWVTMDHVRFKYGLNEPSGDEVGLDEARK